MERAQELHLSGCEALRYGQGDAVLASVLEHGRLTLLDIFGGDERISDRPVLRRVLKHQKLQTLSLTSRT